MDEYEIGEIDDLDPIEEELNRYYEDYHESSDENAASFFTIPAPPVLGKTAWSLR